MRLLSFHAVTEQKEKIRLEVKIHVSPQNVGAEVEPIYYVE